MFQRILNLTKGQTWRIGSPDLVCGCSWEPLAYREQYTTSDLKTYLKIMLIIKNDHDVSAMKDIMIPNLTVSSCLPCELWSLVDGVQGRMLGRRVISNFTQILF